MHHEQVFLFERSVQRVLGSLQNVWSWISIKGRVNRLAISPVYKRHLQQQKMFQKVFLLASVFVVMAIVYANSVHATVEESTDQTFCKAFSSCFNDTDCASNLIYKTCRTNLFGQLQCCL
ncbi:uncharacterized protein LOC130687121 [Daphnia carinata]|uniref:uncharacterized protein LOC130687121 n=1 Tax=Daphnia carinata TaxID=120202 RepID=UPI00257F4DDF|nr:uncharacterized protein LOC130687121 [Daphnia carinata]